jgi:hypothetical protein
VDPIHLERIGNSPNPLRLLFSMNSSRLILNVSSCIAHEGSSALSVTSILPLSRISPTRLRRPERYAKPVPSIAMVVTLHNTIKEKVTRGKEMTGRNPTDKRLPMEPAMRMEEGIPLRPRRPQSTHLFFPMPQSPSSHSYSSFVPLPIFRMLSSWLKRES